MDCLNIEYATRFDFEFEEGCGDRPENAPSLAMMVLCYAAPACVALAAPLLFGTSDKYTKIWVKKYSTKVKSSTKQVESGYQGGSSSSASSGVVHSEAGAD